MRVLSSFVHRGWPYLKILCSKISLIKVENISILLNNKTAPTVAGI